MAWTALDRLVIIRKFGLADKIRLDFFQVVTVLVLSDGCTPWTLKNTHTHTHTHTHIYIYIYIYILTK